MTAGGRSGAGAVVTWTPSSDFPEEASLVLWDEAKRRREELVIHE
jgi:hypothetical protein